MEYTVGEERKGPVMGHQCEPLTLLNEGSSPVTPDVSIKGMEVLGLRLA